MKIKIDAGYRSIEEKDGQCSSNPYQWPYIKADIEIELELLRYINNEYGEDNSPLYDALCSALMRTFSEIAKGVQVY